ncbi:MAG: 3-deoxy-D-manno-octulosonic acid transferase [Bacteroidales bacterium]|nr:3-deoxy-D-manno-octulosonic acid transferase [Bacteroidales bacterium]
MKLLYDIGIGFYKVAIVLFSVFNSKAKKWIRGRKDIFKTIAKSGITKEKIIWFHAASLGEFEQGKPVIEKARKEFPGYKILLTFFSPSGFEIRKDYEMANFVFYLPVDTVRNARKFVSMVNPEFAVFIKYELWLNYIDALYRFNIPLFVISSIFRPEQYYFKWYGKFALKRLRKISNYFVQNEDTKELLARYNVDNVEISGDTRFDRVVNEIKHGLPLPEIEAFTTGRPVFLAGSTWEKDESNIFKVLAKYHDKLTFIIAPHEVSDARINELCKRLKKYRFVLYTELDKLDRDDYNILIINTIGILSRAFRYAKIAYVGGGFGKGIHNILEAATFGKPVIFGPNYNKFAEARQLIKKGGAFSYENEKRLSEITGRLLEDEEYYLQCSGICSDYVKQNEGATNVILEGIKNHFVTISSRKREREEL